MPAWVKTAEHTRSAAITYTYCPWWTCLLTTAVGFLFLPCGAWVVAHRGCTAVRHQDSRGVFFLPHSSPQPILLSTRNRLRQYLLLVGINPHTHYSTTFLCFHSCTARVVALHQERACGASGVRRKNTPLSISDLERKKSFPHDSSGVFFAVRRQRTASHPPYLSCARS